MSLVGGLWSIQGHFGASALTVKSSAFVLVYLHTHTVAKKSKVYIFLPGPCIDPFSECTIRSWNTNANHWNRHARVNTHTHPCTTTIFSSPVSPYFHSAPEDNTTHLAKCQPLSSPLGHMERVVAVIDTSVAQSPFSPHGRRKKLGVWSSSRRALFRRIWEFGIIFL